ncbi:hypothetical protein KCP71_00065 [Salmonella enterica subsp. enterica]|nr:hypothetical protein KCP71_00065 [Salmonella enterica subsp. enterica]
MMTLISVCPATSRWSGSGPTAAVMNGRRGMFGRGWSVLRSVPERTPDNPDENCMTYVFRMGRRIRPAGGGAGEWFLQPRRGLAVRRSEQGHWLISSDDGVYRLFGSGPVQPTASAAEYMTATVTAST